MTWPPGGGGWSARGLRGRGGARRRWRKVLVAAREAVAAAARSQHDQVSPPERTGSPPLPPVSSPFRARGACPEPGSRTPASPRGATRSGVPEPGAPAPERTQLALRNLLGQRSSPTRFASRWKPPTRERSGAVRVFGCVCARPPLSSGWASWWGNGGGVGRPDPNGDSAPASISHTS